MIVRSGCLELPDCTDVNASHSSKDFRNLFDTVRSSPRHHQAMVRPMTPRSPGKTLEVHSERWQEKVTAVDNRGGHLTPQPVALQRTIKALPLQHMSSVISAEGCAAPVDSRCRQQNTASSVQLSRTPSQQGPRLAASPRATGSLHVLPGPCRASPTLWTPRLTRCRVAQQPLEQTLTTQVAAFPSLTRPVLPLHKGLHVPSARAHAPQSTPTMQTMQTEPPQSDGLFRTWPNQKVLHIWQDLQEARDESPLVLATVNDHRAVKVGLKSSVSTAFLTSSNDLGLHMGGSVDLGR